MYPHGIDLRSILILARAWHALAIGTDIPKAGSDRRSVKKAGLSSGFCNLLPTITVQGGMSSSLALEGESEAGDSLPNRLAEAMPRLQAYIRSLVGVRSPIDADDLVQEVCARALRYEGSFDRGRPILPWLKRTALNLFLDQRARRTGMPLEELEHEPQASDRADALEDRDQVASVLTLLNDLEREILLRFHQRGESVRIIAGELGIPDGTVKSHLHRARRKIAERAREDD